MKNTSIFIPVRILDYQDLSCLVKTWTQWVKLLHPKAYENFYMSKLDQ